jgi:cobalt-precorrin 5A hydrolase
MTTSLGERADAPRLALGVGCERGISALNFEQAVLAVLQQHGLALQQVTVLASIDAKAGEPALAAFAAKYRLRTRFYSAAELAARANAPGHASPSAQVEKLVGTPGVSEPAALLAAAADTLLVAKTRYTATKVAGGAGHAMTIAIARVAVAEPAEPAP